jgi:single-strand DNA-binding protein
MAKSVNKVILIGGLGKDPEVRTLPNGTTVANLSLATNDVYKDKNDEFVESVEWHSLVAYGRTAEIVRDHLVKGSKIYVEGKLQTRSWEDKTSGEKKYRTEVVVQDVNFMSTGTKKEHDDDDGKIAF